MSDSSGFRFRKIVVLPQLTAALLLSACANNFYMGMPLVEGVSDPALRSLAERASAGDKQAQLDLGIRYEEGNGVPVDLKRAKKLYRLAASDSGGSIWIYSPPARSGMRGRVIQSNAGPKSYGLSEAKLRLGRLP